MRKRTFRIGVVKHCLLHSDRSHFGELEHSETRRVHVVSSDRKSLFFVAPVNIRTICSRLGSEKHLCRLAWCSRKALYGNIGKASILIELFRC